MHTAAAKERAKVEYRAAIEAGVPGRDPGLLPARPSALRLTSGISPAAMQTD
jgi:hypothetical protein